MPELPVTSFGSDQAPPVVLENERWTSTTSITCARRIAEIMIPPSNRPAFIRAARDAMTTQPGG